MNTDELKDISDRAAAATPGPWFFNGYSGVFGEHLVREYLAWERKLEEKLGVEGRDAVDDDFDTAPETLVANVPAYHGDTATAQGAEDAEFIAASRSAVPALLAHIREQDETIAQAFAMVAHLR